jgi:hypothetical protein
LKALENQNLTNPSDERLQVEAARQDPAHFAELCEDNFERVYAYVAHLLQLCVLCFGFFQDGNVGVSALP